MRTINTRRLALRNFSGQLEERAVPSVSPAGNYALASDTRTFGGSVYDDPSGIRNRTGDPSLAAPAVTVYGNGGQLFFTTALGPAFSGGARVASVDFDLFEGVPVQGVTAVVATAPGVPNRLRVVSRDGTVFETTPFEPTFTGGVNVTTGDLTGDGIPEVIVSPDEGGGPRVDVYSFGPAYSNPRKVASFFGIDDANFRGGVRPAVGDIDGDGTADLIVAAGFGGGPRVAVFAGESVATGTPVKLFNDFFAFEPTLRNGVYVTAGDLNGDRFDELIFGGGPGGGPRVLAVSGKDLMSSGGATRTPVANFFAGDAADRSGVRVVAKRLDRDIVADLIVAEGPSGDRNNPNKTVRFYAGAAVVASGTPTPLEERSEFGSFAFNAFLDGVYVG